jgi:hypothetical protein
MQNEQIELLSLASLDDESVLAFPVPDRIFGFHAHQAVEKLLKMLILGNRQRHKFTHNIRILSDHAEDLGEILPPLPFPIIELTDFAAESVTRQPEFWTRPNATGSARPSASSANTSTPGCKPPTPEPPERRTHKSNA